VQSSNRCKLARASIVIPPGVSRNRRLDASPLFKRGRAWRFLKDVEKKWTTTMAAEKPQNLQDTFLNYVRKNNTPLTIFLINGVKLQGIVSWFDNFCVLLRRDGHSQLVYKHAISTIMPGGPVNLNDQDESGAG
jgi:host factor-I protein